MKLYYSPGACSLAAHIVLEEIGKPYELVPVLVHMGETSKPSFLSVNPKGRVPVLVDDEIITELPAILTYLSLSNIESNLLPADPVGVARALEWLNWLSSNVHTQAYGQVWRPMRFTENKEQYGAIVGKGMENIKEAYSQIDSKLKGRTWALGDEFSCVDPFLVVFHLWGDIIGLPMKQYTYWGGHARRMSSRASVQAALKQEGLSLRV